MCFGGGAINTQQKSSQPNVVPIPAGNFVPPGGGSYAPKGMTLTPYQNGVGSGLMGAGNLQQGMNLAQGSYNKLGQMGDQFMQDAKHAGDPNYNPGIGAFQSATNQNMQNTAAALASQRGSSADPGLAARNIGEMGARTQQGAVSQLGQIVAGYKGQQQGNALNAFGAQGQEAGVYGQIANSYAQMGLQNQASILGAIAAQNMAQVTMQSNINSTNAQMFGQQLGYTANIFGTQGSMYNAQLGYNSSANQQNNSMWGGILGGVGGLLAFLNEGGVVGRDGYQRYAKGGSVNRVPRYANGGRIPETKRRKMADGGAADPFAVTSVQSGPFKGMKYGDQSDNSGAVGAFSGGSNQAMKADAPQSIIGRMMKGMQIPSAAMPIQQGQGGTGAPSPVTGMARGGQVPARRYAMGGSIDPRQQQQMRGPMIPNTGLAGSTNPGIASPPTGLPMGGVQTRGGGPLPAPGASGAYQPPGQPQMDQQSRPMYAQGGYAQPQMRRTWSPGEAQQNDDGQPMHPMTNPQGGRQMQFIPNGQPTPNGGFNIGGANPEMRDAPQWDKSAPFRRAGFNWGPSFAPGTRRG